jgi:hypothetical protein
LRESAVEQGRARLMCDDLRLEEDVSSSSWRVPEMQ